MNQSAAGGDASSHTPPRDRRSSTSSSSSSGTSYTTSYGDDGSDDTTSVRSVQRADVLPSNPQRKTRDEFFDQQVSEKDYSSVLESLNEARPPADVEAHASDSETAYVAFEEEQSRAPPPQQKELFMDGFRVGVAAAILARPPAPSSLADCPLFCSLADCPL